MTSSVFVVERDSLPEVAEQVFHGLATQGWRQSIKRENMETAAWALTPAYYSFQATRARGDFDAWRQSVLLAACEIVSEWHGLNPTLGGLYFRKYHEFVALEAGRETYTYGERLRLDHQLGNCAERLRGNPDTRQAQAVIYMPEDTHKGHWHAPCTVGYQFTRQDPEGRAAGDALDMRVTMRSQDFARGMKYDALQASFVLQAVALDAGMEPGRVGFFVGNLHVYEADKAKLDFGDFVGANAHGSWLLSPGEAYSYQDFLHEVEDLRSYEFQLRTTPYEYQSPGFAPKGVREFQSPVLQLFGESFRRHWASGVGQK